MDGGLQKRVAEKQQMWPIPIFRVAIIAQFCFVCLFLIIFLLKQFVNDFLDSFVLFMFQGVQVNPFRYNLPFYTIYLYLE